jgi:hypothetical protein
MAPTTAQIRAELDSDPKSLGFATLRLQTNNAEACAARLNEVGASSETLTPMWTSSDEVKAVLVGTEILALDQAHRDMLAILTSTVRIKTGSLTLRTAVAAIFGGATTSRANLIALTTKSCSRAEALWGEGYKITDAEVGLALEN